MHQHNLCQYKQYINILNWYFECSVLEKESYTNFLVLLCEKST